MMGHHTYILYIYIFIYFFLLKDYIDQDEIQSQNRSSKVIWETNPTRGRHKPTHGNQLSKTSKPYNKTSDGATTLRI